MKTASKAAVASLKRNLKDIDERAPRRRQAARGIGMHSKNASSHVSLEPNARFRAELGRYGAGGDLEPGSFLPRESGR